VQPTGACPSAAAAAQARQDSYAIHCAGCRPQRLVQLGVYVWMQQTSRLKMKGLMAAWLAEYQSDPQAAPHHLWSAPCNRAISHLEQLTVVVSAAGESEPTGKESGISGGTTHLPDCRPQQGQCCSAATTLMPHLCATPAAVAAAAAACHTLGQHALTPFLSPVLPPQHLHATRVHTCCTAGRVVDTVVLTCAKIRGIA